MKTIRLITAAVLCAAVVAPQAALAGRNPGPVKFTMMTRLETHTKTFDGLDSLSGETYGYESLSMYRELQQNTFGSLMYIMKYSFDREDDVSHIGGVNVIHVFSPYVVASLGYTHSSNPNTNEFNWNTGDVMELEEDRDRLSLSVIWKLNPHGTRGPKFSLTTGFSTVTDWNEQRTFSEKLQVDFPNISNRISGMTSYTFTYSLNESDQLTNQFLGRLSYKYSDTTRMDLEGLFLDNVFENNRGDDSVFRMSLYRYVR